MPKARKRSLSAEVRALRRERAAIQSALFEVFDEYAIRPWDHERKPGERYDLTALIRDNLARAIEGIAEG